MKNNIFRWAGKILSGLLKIEFKEGEQTLKKFFQLQDRLYKEGLEKNILLFLDYDGTLTPIAQTPQQAILSPENKELLEQLTKNSRISVVIISGRALKDVKHMVGIEGIMYMVIMDGK